MVLDHLDHGVVQEGAHKLGEFLHGLAGSGPPHGAAPYHAPHSTADGGKQLLSAIKSNNERVGEQAATTKIQNEQARRLNFS